MSIADQIAEAERAQRWGHVEELKRIAAAEGVAIAPNPENAALEGGDVTEQPQ